MRKICNILFMSLLMCGIAAVSFAQTTSAVSMKKSAASTEVLRGKITSIDLVKNEMVVKINKTGVESVIVVDPKILSSLKIDEEVRVTVKTGSNVAEQVKKVIKSIAPTTKSSKK